MPYKEGRAGSNGEREGSLAGAIEEIPGGRAREVYMEYGNINR